MPTTPQASHGLLFGAATATVAVAACLYLSRTSQQDQPRRSRGTQERGSRERTTRERGSRQGKGTERSLKKTSSRKAIERRSVGGVPNLVFISLSCVKEESGENNQKQEVVDALCVVEVSAESAHVVFSLSCHLARKAEDSEPRQDFSSISSLLSSTLSNKVWILCDKRDVPLSSAPFPPSAQLLQSLFLSSSPPTPRAVVPFQELRRKALGLKEGEEASAEVAAGSPVGYSSGSSEGSGRLGPAFDICHGGLSSI